MTIKRSRKIILLCVSLWVCIGTFGCNYSAPSEPTALVTTVAVVQEQPTATATMKPSPTPEPEIVVLLAPPGSDPAKLEEMQSILNTLVDRDGMRLETRKEIIEGGVHPNVRLVVILPPYTETANLALEYPDTSFLAVGFSDLEAAQNLFVISSSGGKPDQQSFLAGYIAAVVTKDWRVGVITLSDSEAGGINKQAFTNGTIFFCGLCRPVYPPYYQYPMAVELATGASQDQQIAVADALINSAVETVYIAPGAGESVLFVYLSENGIKLIGGELPPLQIQNQWIATIRADLADAIAQNWDKLFAGEAGFRLESPLVLIDINDALFSPGKQEFVNRVMADLLAGYVDTGAAP